MADDKKSIPDAGKVDEPPKLGKVEPAKAAPPVQEQPTPAKTEAPVVEDVPKVVAPPAAEAPKDKGTSAPSKEGTPQPGKDEKQTTIPGMGDPAPAGKVVDFTAARDGATKGKPPEKAVAQDKDKQADKAKDAAKPRRGRPPKADKAAPDKAKPQPRDKMSQSKPPAEKGAPATAEAPAATEQPPAPRDAARGVKEEIVYLNLSELHPFKNHPFGVRDDAEMQGLVESVKAAGVTAEAHGLHIEKHAKYGWTVTTLAPEAEAWIRETLGEDKINASRLPVEGTTRVSSIRNRCWWNERPAFSA